MKIIRVEVFIVLCLMFMGSLVVQAQSHRDGVPYLMGQISEQMNDELSDLPVSIRRVAVYKLNYSSMRFSEQEVEFIRGEVEANLREFAGLTVLSPPELEPNDKMKILGNDSTLQVLNIQGRSLADVSPEYLAQISNQYAVQGLVELTLQKRNPEGLVISVRMISPESREIIWSKSFISQPFIVKEEIDPGKIHMLHFGVGSRQTESLFRADTSLSSNPDTSIQVNAISFEITYTFRQSLNEEKSAYIGFTGGLNILRATDASQFDVNLMQLGATYYQALSKKNEDIDDYRLKFFVNANVQFAIDNTKGQVFSTRPGLVLNLSNNLGLSFYSSFILSGETLTLENNNRITYDKIGYGVQAVVRF